MRQIYDKIEQGTYQWLELRLGKVTASNMKLVCTKPRNKSEGISETAKTYAHKLIAESLTGIPTDNYVNENMQMGTDLEPVALEYYKQNFSGGKEVKAVGFITDFNHLGTVGYSPDALVGDDGLLEIKCRVPHVQVEVLMQDKPTPAHIYQMQCGMWVSGRKWCDYESFSAYLPPAVFRQEANPLIFEEMEERVTAFNKYFVKGLEIITEKLKKAPPYDDKITALLEGRAEIDYKHA